MMNKAIYLAIIAFISIVILLTPSCSKYTFVDCETYDYYDCNTTPPGVGKLEVNVNFPNGEKHIPIVIYRGTYPSKDTVRSDTMNSGFRSYTLDVSYTYSVTAEYFIDGERYIAVDGDDIRQKSYNVCDSVCWEVKDGKVNLELKFEKN